MRPILPNVTNRHYRKAMSLGKRNDFGQARHRSVSICQLTQHRVWRQFRQRHKVYATLRMPIALQYPTGTGYQRKHMPRTGQISRLAIIGYSRPYCFQPVVSRNACSHPTSRLDGNCKIGTITARVMLHHRGQAKRPSFISCKAKAHNATTGTNHQSHIFHLHTRSGKNQISLILTTLIIDQQDALACTQSLHSTLYSFPTIAKTSQQLFFFHNSFII